MSIFGKRVGIMAELDCILDTRLGTISKISDDLAIQVMKDGYHDRLSDHIPGVDYEEFQRLYQARDVETLLRSVCTPVVAMLNEIADAIEDDSQNGLVHSGAAIHINYWPYDLQESDIEVLKSAVEYWVQNKYPVEFVSISPEDLTPQFVGLNYAVLFIYRYDEWMELQTKHFNATPKNHIPSVRLITPGIRFSGPEDKESIRKFVAANGDPYEDMKRTASPLIELDFTIIGVFSAFDKQLLQLTDGEQKEKEA